MEDVCHACLYVGQLCAYRRSRFFPAILNEIARLPLFAGLPDNSKEKSYFHCYCMLLREPALLYMRYAHMEHSWVGTRPKQIFANFAMVSSDHYEQPTGSNYNHMIHLRLEYRCMIRCAS